MKARHTVDKEEPAGPVAPDGNRKGHGATEVEEVRAALQKAIDERDQRQDQLLRTMADFQNFRKRQEDQRRQLEQFATERLVSALLPVLDNFDRALSSFDAGASTETTIDGLRAVDRQFRQVLESQNLTRIASVGEVFDPEVHEALVMEPSEEHEDNTVIGELEAGYRMGEKVIRPARVRVAKRP